MKIAFVMLSVLAVTLAGFSVGRAAQFGVDIQNFAFTPHARHISAGDMITWTNRAAISHTSTSDNSLWNSGPLSPGQTYSHTFSSPGSYPYHCAIHTEMMDTVFVSARAGTGEQSSVTPNEFDLSPNYPNPFNVQTTIRYTIGQDAHVELEIFNVLGQKVDNLFDGRQSAGDHQIVWNAADQTSGVFFYRVNVDGQVKMGRMTLLK